MVRCMPLLLALAAPLAQAQDAGQLNVICSVQAEWCNMIQTVFARSTGVKINMALKGSAPAGPVTLAVRPEAWQLGAAGGDGLAATVAKRAYLGSGLELTLATALGEIFIVAPDTRGAWAPGDAATLTLSARGVAVVGQ